MLWAKQEVQRVGLGGAGGQPRPGNFYFTLDWKNTTAGLKPHCQAAEVEQLNRSQEQEQLSFCRKTSIHPSSIPTSSCYQGLQGFVGAETNCQGEGRVAPWMCRLFIAGPHRKRNNHPNSQFTSYVCFCTVGGNWREKRLHANSTGLIAASFFISFICKVSENIPVTLNPNTMSGLLIFF